MAWANAKAELSFGKHGLQVFNERRYASLALKELPKEMRTSWEVFHEGRTIAVMKDRNGFGLVHVLRDPARKGNLLAVRKEDTSSPYGKIRLCTVTLAGEEMPVAEAKLSLNPPSLVPYISNLHVKPYSVANPLLRHKRIGELEKKIKKLRTERVQAGSAAEDRRLEEMRALFAEKVELEKSFDWNSLRSKEPQGQKIYHYRGHGLASLLIDLSEELARTTGAPRIEAHFNKFNLGDAPTRHGWKRVSKISGVFSIFDHYRKPLRPKRPGLLRRLLGL